MALGVVTYTRLTQPLVSQPVDNVTHNWTETF